MNAPNDMIKNNEPVDLSNCDREPIHIPGSIQPHGALLAFDAAGRLAIHSDNASALLGALPTIGQTLSDAHLTAQLRQVITTALSHDDQHDDLFGIDLASAKFDVIFSKSDGLTLVEFERCRDVGMSIDAFPVLAHRAIDRVQRQTSTEELLDVVVNEVHALTGFDRVMGYRFLPDESGEVVAERKRADLESFKGQRYPSGDIPAQARRLYVLNPLRLIADVAYQPVPLTPQINPLTGAPLDLSRSVLRSVSPIHIEYLTNMGVMASMSISIVVNGKLWGMIACHHMSPHLVPRAVRMSCQLLSQIVSVLVERTLSQEHVKAIEYSSATRRKISDRTMQAGDFLQALVEQNPGFCDLIASQGGAVAIDGRVETCGEIPPPAQAVLDLIDWLEENETADIFATDSIVRDIPALAGNGLATSGLLAARFHRERSGYVFWFRNEQIENVRWGGNPQKIYSTGPLGARLTPRGSFAEWQEEVKGKSSAWLPSELEIASQFRNDLQEIALTKSTLSERARDTLFAMLGHDLRDPLQAIMMAAQLLERQNEGDASKATLGKRIVNSSGRMKRLISEVLDVSRIQNGLGLSVAPVPTDIGTILHDLVRETTTAHPNLQIDLECSTAGTANVDPDRIGQVVSNLLSNARHHGDSEQPIIVHAIGDDSRVKISVTNHGQAIDPKLIPTLFNPFKAGHRPNRKNPTGLGLGLYIVNEIVSGHNGTIDVRCEDGKVTFHMEFPR
jgi:chemotaxis family two-component system sensor kinase Cph1